MTANSKRLVLILACLVFFALGGVTAALGPALPDLADNASVELAVIGSLFTGVFLGALVAQMAAGPLTDRLGQPRVITLGVIILSAGTFLLTFSRSLPLTLGFAFLAGLGHGAVDLAGNVWIARVFNTRSLSALNLLNFFFGLGAFAGPAAASLSLRAWGSALPALWISAGIPLALIPFLIKAGNEPPTPLRAPSEAAGSPPRGLYASPVLWALGLVVLIYVGTENGIGGWTTTYMQRTTPLPVETAALVTAGFWLALTAGRMASTALGLRVSPRTLLSVSLLGSVCGGALLVFGRGNITLTTAAVLWTGFCFGPVYPTVMAILTSIFHTSPGKAVGVAASMGSVGGMLLPWLQGILLESSADGAASALFSAAGPLLMVVLVTVLLSRLRLPVPARPEQVTPATVEES